MRTPRFPGVTSLALEMDSEVFTAYAGGPDVPGGVLSFAWTFTGQGLQLHSQPTFKAIFVDDGYRKSGGITEVAMQQSTAPVPRASQTVASGHRHGRHRGNYTTKKQSAPEQPVRPVVSRRLVGLSFGAGLETDQR